MIQSRRDVLVNRSPITLAFLFYLVTFGGIISACLRTLSLGDFVTQQSLALVVGIGMAIGAAMGGILGLLYFRSMFVAAVAGGVGIAVGALAGALALVSGDRFVEIGMIAFGGSWLMIVTMVLSARYKHYLH